METIDVETQKCTHNFDMTKQKAIILIGED
jgi:hypothetical protein